jgi:hypothetical protein
MVSPKSRGIKYGDLKEALELDSITLSLIKKYTEDSERRINEKNNTLYIIIILLLITLIIMLIIFYLLNCFKSSYI